QAGGDHGRDRRGRLFRHADVLAVPDRSRRRRRRRPGDRRQRGDEPARLPGHARARTEAAARRSQSRAEGRRRAEARSASAPATARDRSPAAPPRASRRLMRRLLVVAVATLALLTGPAVAQPPVLGFTLSAAPHSTASLPSATVPNAPGQISVPISFTTPPALTHLLDLNELHQLWQRAGGAYGIPWNVLAAINKVESNFGQNMGPSSAGAIGWMQFMPSTWLRWGVDADGDGVADPWNATDAVYAAARYLAAAGGQADIARGVFAYNHADWYVREVLDLANVYGGGGLTQTAGLERVQKALQLARRRVIAANARVEAAESGVRRLQGISE